MTTSAADGRSERSDPGRGPLRLAEGETLAEAFKRTLIDEIVGAIALLGDPARDRGETIHFVRRRLKRTRSLFSVVEAVPGADRPARSRRIRDTARMLAAGRDADVAVALARRLAADGEPEVAEAARGLIAHLERRAEAAHAGLPPFATVIVRLEASEADARSLPERFAAGRMVAAALLDCYRRGRDDWRQIVDGAGAATLHDWRKRVKERRHLSALVPFATPVTGRSVQADLDDLAGLLGEEHDLALMIERLTDEPDLVERRGAREALLAEVARRRRRFEKRALLLGEELYGERTRHFGRALTGLDEL
jgi:CHAD domain-containing protein